MILMELWVIYLKKVQTLTRSIHSGNFGGLVPDPLMIYRNLMGKIGHIKI